MFFLYLYFDSLVKISENLIIDNNTVLDNNHGVGQRQQSFVETALSLLLLKVGGSGLVDVNLLPNFHMLCVLLLSLSIFERQFL